MKASASNKEKKALNFVDISSKIMCCVADKPSVTIERHTSSELEAGVGSLTLTCVSRSNPPGRTMWYRQGQAAAPQYRWVMSLQRRFAKISQ